MDPDDSPRSPSGPLIALFFDAKQFGSAPYDGEYGPSVKRAVLDAILTLSPQRRLQFQTWWGALMLPMFRPSSAGSDGTFALTHDQFLLWTSATTLCRDADAHWVIPAATVPWLLATNDGIYLGVISGLSSDLRGPLHQALTAHPWYVGMMAVNPTDALHQRVFDLIPGWRYNEGWIDDDPAHLDPQEVFADLPVAGFGPGPTALLDGDVCIPWRRTSEVAESNPQTYQQTLTALLYDDPAVGETNPQTYQEALTALLYHYTEAERPLAFTVGRRHPVVDDLYGKLHGYALNPDHPDGGPKARFFRTVLDLGQEDWRLLAIQLISALVAAEPAKFRDNPSFGKQHLRFDVTVRVLGLNGRTAAVTAAWKIEDDGPVQLVTVTPGRKKGVVEQNDDFKTDDWTDDWAGLYAIAVEVADQARRDCRPTPFALGGNGSVDVIAEGMCGFAWVKFTNPDTPFVSWLRARGHIRDDDTDASVSAPTHNYEPASAWAEAFAAVVQAAGQDCTVTALID